MVRALLLASLLLAAAFRSAPEVREREPGTAGEDREASSGGTADGSSSGPVSCRVAVFAHLVADDGDPQDAFGSAVDVSGGTAVVGARGDLVGAGSAYVFERDLGGPGAWGQAAKLTASDGAPFDAFGSTAVIDGDTILVGAPANDELHDNAGAVYVFERDLGGPGSWGEAQKLLPHGSKVAARFGSALEISGDTAVVGVPNGRTAYVFERSTVRPGGWSQRAVLEPDTQASTFGRDVGISGDTIVVGTQAERAWIFRRDAGGPGAWGQVATVADPTGSAWGFGNEVAISGDTIVVGAERTASLSGLCAAGAAFFFERDLGGPGAWGLAARVEAPVPMVSAKFGFSVALEGDRAAIGAPFEETAVKRTAGRVHVLERDAGGPGAWGEVLALEARPVYVTLRYGEETALDGDTLLAGQPGGDEGSTDLFELTAPPLPTVTTRTAGTNPSSLSASPAVLGGTLSGTCDLTTTGHTLAVFFAFEAPTTLTLGGGQTLLALDAGSGELLSGGGILATGQVPTFSVAVPADRSLCGMELHLQAAHLLGPGPFRLSNAQDLVVGEFP